MKKADAVESYKKGQKRQATQLYPAVEEQDQLQASTVSSEAPPKKKRKKPTCGKPKKGHKAALCIDQS